MSKISSHLTTVSILKLINVYNRRWWKGKLKGEGDDADEPVGLIPANYVEEVR